MMDTVLGGRVEGEGEREEKKKEGQTLVKTKRCNFYELYV